MKTLKTITAVIFIAILGCNKMESINPNVRIDDSIKNKIHLALMINKKSNQNHVLNYPVNLNNPYDSIGFIHNEALIYLKENNYLNDTSLINNGIATYFNTTEFNDINNISSNLVSENEEVFVNNTFEGGFINNLNISNLEKDYLVTYFETLHTTTYYNDRIENSIIIEDLVIEDVSLTQSEKNRLLKCFSLYRYSVEFWENEGNGTSNTDRIVNFWDSIAEYWAMHSPNSPAQDGKDINAIATFFSALMAVLIN